MIRLIPVTAALAGTVNDAKTFQQTYDASLGEVAELVRDVVEQSEEFRATSGASPEWGGYLGVDSAQRRVIGTCAFVGGPNADGEIEIAYFTFPPYEGQGFGTAMAGALVEQAIASGAVRLVYAHTLPESNASTSILMHYDFILAGTAEDSDAGEVWRWERVLDSSEESSTGDA